MMMADEGLLNIASYPANSSSSSSRSTPKDGQGHLNQVNRQHRQRRSGERANSLALPQHDSLLDFYDKQQQECNSVALLPPLSVNMVVRRHSSHYYPIQVDEKEEEEEELNPLRISSILQQPQDTAIPFPTVAIHSHIHPSTHDELPLNGVDLSFRATHSPSLRVTPSSSLPTANQIQDVIVQYNNSSSKISLNSPSSAAVRSAYNTSINSNYSTKFNYNSEYNALPALKIQFGSHQRRKESPRHLNNYYSSTDPGTVSRTQRYSRNTWNNSIHSTTEGGADVVNYGTNIGHRYRPPSPLPLTMDEKHYSEVMDYRQCQSQDLITGSSSGTTTTTTTTTTTITANNCDTVDSAPFTPTFCYDNNIYFNGEFNNRQSPKPIEGLSPFREDRLVGVLDNGDLSDDDRMSIENSVFESASNHSTPIKFTKNDRRQGHSTSYSSSSLSTSVIARALNMQSSNSSVNKRIDRSSCSTVDSSMTSSGYGTHSERLTSSSTSANVEYRSRISSMDTECSLDSSSHDLPEKLDKVNDDNKKEDIKDDGKTVVVVAAVSSKLESGQERQTKDILPKVPARPKLSSTEIIPKSITRENPALSIDFSCMTQSVSNSSTSASSTTSTGSSILSTGSFTTTGSSVSVSSSASVSGNATGNHSPSLNVSKKRPEPPKPPARHPNPKKAPSTREMSTSSQTYSEKGKFIKNPNKRPALETPSKDTGEDTGQTKQDIGKWKTGKCPSNTQTGILPAIPPRKKLNNRQDSTISSDSFSQTSSPGFNSKNMEMPLLPVLNKKRLCNVPSTIQLKQKYQAEPIAELDYGHGLSMAPILVSPLTAKRSNHQTPSLQTIVRFQNGNSSTIPLPHQIIGGGQKHSNGMGSAGGGSYSRPFGRYRFRILQLLINVLALMIIAGSLAAYFHAHPTVRFVNKTIINTVHIDDSLSYGKNPAPGTCLPIIVKFCQGSQIPYNFTVFPNYIGHFGQLETQVDLDAYEALVDVRCYELVSLFLCSLFVPKCGANGATVPPCKSLCLETMRRCGFFFDVFGLNLPEYLNCKLFKDFESPEDCVGFIQVRDVMMAFINPQCDGFQCDHKRCLPPEYVCDGHLDCMDQTDEASCPACSPDEIYCGQEKCVSSQHICDGVIDCPYGQDERNCMRLSRRNGDLGTGILEVYRIGQHRWTPACVKLWDRAVSPMAVCSMLGYSSVNATTVITQKTHRPLLTSVNVSDVIWKTYAKHHKSTLMQELANCAPDEDYPIAELTCSNFECGKVHKLKHHTASRRIIGGARSQPGSWPFLAAILGGPEKIFYCAGVLISDQWVLTASHCIGNHTIIDLEDWTIQLGITRRDSFTYSSQRVKVKAVIPHPLYNIAIPHDNDIALFQLATRVAFHEQLLPVCLPPSSVKLLKPDTMCTVIGWGKREDKDPKATYEMIVNEVQVPIIRRQLCDNWLDNLTISDGMICAGFENGGRDACQGDSGGPLLCPYPGEVDKWFVGGIVSWGIMCAHPKLPGVYANVIKYVPWIQEQMQKHLKSSQEEKTSKYDSPPGGPNILSNFASTTTIKKKKPFAQHPTGHSSGLKQLEN